MNLLIPIDFSKNALNAARFAFTNYPGSNFTLLNIVHSKQAGAIMAVNINQDLKVVHQGKMTKTIVDFKNDFQNLNITGKVEIGLFAETIIEEIENTSADIIVLGTNGSNRMDEVLFGSNAYLAIKNSSVPLIIIPENYDLKPPKKILLASDFEGNISNETAQPLLDFINRFGAEIHVLHISRPDQINKVKARINSTLDNEIHKFHIIASDDVINDIITYAKKHDFDFLALAPKYRGIIKNLFHKSVTKQVSALAKCPIFIMK